MVTLHKYLCFFVAASATRKRIFWLEIRFPAEHARHTPPCPRGVEDGAFTRFAASRVGEACARPLHAP